MKVRDVYITNPAKNVNNHSDYINYIDTSSVNQGRLDNVQYLLNGEYPSRAQRKIEDGDILYSSVRPNLRHYYLYKDCLEHPVASTGFVLLRQYNFEYDNKFCYYYLSTNSIVTHLSNIAELSQATFPSCSSKDIENINLPNFTFNKQRRIASILSAYDNLIENNNKRIHLLELMAENLYKEWFVRFRFPGYEKTEFENGLPKGWSKAPLSTICDFKKGKNITSDEMCEGPIPVISAGVDASGYHNTSNVKGASVTMSSSGANAGFISIHYSDIWAADCSYIEETTTPNIFYVYELLNNIRSIITNFQRGAAQPHVYPKDINRIKLIIPEINIIEVANKKFETIHNEIYKLQHQSTLLSRQRDLLLPRLMSGKLEV